jgi:hypothetical protein
VVQPRDWGWQRPPVFIQQPLILTGSFQPDPFRPWGGTGSFQIQQNFQQPWGGWNGGFPQPRFQQQIQQPGFQQQFSRGGGG